VGDEDDARVDRSQELLEPFDRLDVEVVGRLVEKQEIRLRGERPREGRTRQLAARESGERAIEVVLAEAETRTTAVARSRQS